MQNLAIEIANGLRAVGKPDKKLWRTGNMMGSIFVVQVDDNYCDVVIATDYASFTNTRGKWAGWVQETINRVCRSYASNNNVDDMNLSGIITYGG